MSIGHRNRGRLLTNKDSEFRCEVCGARCTQSPNDGTEYGHLIGCPERPDHLEISASSGSNYYGGDDS